MHKVWCPSGHVLISLQKLPAVCRGWLRSEKAVLDLSITPRSVRVKKGQSRLWVRSDAVFGFRLGDFRFFTCASLCKVSQKWDVSHPIPDLNLEGEVSQDPSDPIQPALGGQCTGRGFATGKGDFQAGTCGVKASARVNVVRL